MDYIKNKKTLFCPSFKFERKTKAFNKYILFFVSLISLFTVGIGIGTFYYPFMDGFLNLVNLHMELYLFPPIIVYVALTYQCIQFLSCLLSSYQFKNNAIVCGRIKEGDKGIIQRIMLNSNYEFVEKYFDTERYKKKEYTNPILIKETKYSLIYTCDNKRKLVIPKIYNGICSVNDSKGSSFIGRILKISVIVFIVVLIIANIDLFTAYSKNDEYLNNISVSKNYVEQQLDDYGYSINKYNDNVFEKSVGNGERTSTIKYQFDKNGNVTNVELQLYYNSDSENVENELRTIFNTMDTSFDSQDIDCFVDLVEQNINDGFQYGKISSEKYTLIISRSSGFVDIH